MTLRLIIAALLLLLSPACGLTSGPGGSGAGPGGEPDGGPGGGPDGGPGGGPDGGPGGGPPPGGGDRGLPELNWTPGEIQDARVESLFFVAQPVETSAGAFEGTVGAKIGAMYQALEGTKVEKTGPAFVVLSDPWGPTMQVTVGFPVAPSTKADVLPEGFTLETLPEGNGLSMVFQGARGRLQEADTALLEKAESKATDGGTRIYVFLDRPEEAGPEGPKTKVTLRLSE